MDLSCLVCCYGVLLCFATMEPSSVFAVACCAVMELVYLGLLAIFPRRKGVISSHPRIIFH